MTEQSGNDGQDDFDRTRRLDPADGSSGGSTHRYGEPYPPYSPTSHQTAPESERGPLGGFGFAPAPEQRPTTPRSARPSGGVVAGLLAAALLVGGLGGFAGAAGFTAVDHLTGDD